MTKRTTTPNLDAQIHRACIRLYETLIAPGERGPILKKAIAQMKRLVRLFGEQAKTNPSVREGLSRLVANISAADEMMKGKRRGSLQ